MEMDRELDGVSDGPAWLAQPDVAHCVCDSLHFGAEKLRHYRPDAYVVMSNHVHALIVPAVPVPRIMKGIKTTTAIAANKVLGRTGSPFWQDESFDHWCRSEEEILKIWMYIENNPVKAGLVRNPSEWPWSSAAHKRER
jgi:REP element-mobilizing transposase RayT